VGYCFGGDDVHADVLFGGYRRAKATTELRAFSKTIRRRPPGRRIYLVGDNGSTHWTPAIRAWAARRNVEPVATPTAASYLNRIECHCQPLREFVLNAADYASHAAVARACRRYLTVHWRRRAARGLPEGAPMDRVLVWSPAILVVLAVILLRLAIAQAAASASVPPPASPRPRSRRRRRSIRARPSIGASVARARSTLAAAGPSRGSAIRTLCPGCHARTHSR
jgi:hypothetical protein